MISDEFKPEKHITPKKVQANVRIAHEIAKRYGTDDDVVLLDSPAGMSAGFVRAAIPDLPRDNLHVPHPDAGYERAVVELGEMVSWYDATIFEFLRDGLATPLRAHIWFDYCCTWDGSPEMTLPAVDIEMALFKGVLKREGGVLAVTLSTRGMSAADTRAAVTAKLDGLGADYGYAFREVFEPVAYGTVVLLCYESQ